jgi:uncharacterized membrane protein YqjE
VADPAPEDASGSTRSASGPDAVRRPGLVQALLVGIAVVAAVGLAALVTRVLPPDGRDVVFRTPLLIVVLIVGTAFVLWRITRSGRPGR